MDKDQNLAVFVRDEEGWFQIGHSTATELGEKQQIQSAKLHLAFAQPDGNVVANHKQRSDALEKLHAKYIEGIIAGDVV